MSDRDKERRGLPALLFPASSRRVPGKRGINLALRSLHLVGIAGLAGHFLYRLPPEHWLGFLWLGFGAGLAMVLLELYCDGVWLLQLRGQAILGKLVLLGLVIPFPQLLAPMFVLAILISGFFAHAPGRVRYYSLYHGRVVKALRDADGGIKNSGQP
ncbi:hypothetical protein GCM10011348_36350 [Marinobacterium nitratireducens]|uniref:Transmembrane protein n=1 Tax=Marinobacterium nitratireducens TaxID=518897 RepID=A0A917ZLX6_9GAMM|nr:hypothetical protein [Marinobacterium nitratireducens]GGO86157.1 hypothetical protein GCM10011348_36350 [Marinobacterium nitratireducens]